MAARKSRRWECRRARVSGGLVAAAATAAAVAALNRPAGANPFFNLSLLGKDLTTGDASYSSSISVNAGDSISYEILGQMAPTGTTNVATTITALVQNNDGCNSLKFDLFQLSTDPIQSNFSSAATLLSGWGTGSGSSGGSPSARGNGDNNLGGIRPAQITGTYVGINLTILATGTFTVASIDSGGGASSLSMRWNTGGTGSLRINNGQSVNITTSTESGADPLVGYQALTLLSSAAVAGSGTWSVNSSGNWSTPGNWQGNVPSTSGATASFASAIQVNRTVTLDSPRTVGSLAFDNAHSYTLAGTSTLTLSAGGANASISVANGSHTISAPVALASNLSVNVSSSSGGALTISSDLSAAGRNVTKSGSGTLHLKNLRAATATIAGGSIHILASNQSPNSTSILSATPVIANGSQLDIEDNALVINYTAADTTHSTRDAIRNLLKLGRNGGPGQPGAWNGNGGITSTFAHANGNGFNLAIGYGDNEDIALVRGSGSYTAFGGQTVSSNTVLVQMTRGADATLDGVVDAQDVTILGSHFNKPNSGQWVFGDFDYSGTCDATDVTTLGSTFGKTTPTLSPAQMAAEFGSAFTQAFEGGRAAAAPEPGIAMTGAGCMATIAFSRRRRRRLRIGP